MREEEERGNPGFTSAGTLIYDSLEIISLEYRERRSGEDGEEMERR